MLRRGGIQSFRTMKLDYYECTIGITSITFRNKPDRLFHKKSPELTGLSFIKDVILLLRFSIFFFNRR